MAIETLDFVRLLLELINALARKHVVNEKDKSPSSLTDKTAGEYVVEVVEVPTAALLTTLL